MVLEEEGEAEGEAEGEEEEEEEEKEEEEEEEGVSYVEWYEESHTSKIFWNLMAQK